MIADGALLPGLLAWIAWTAMAAPGAALVGFWLGRRSRP